MNDASDLHFVYAGESGHAVRNLTLESTLMRAPKATAMRAMRLEPWPLTPLRKMAPKKGTARMAIITCGGGGGWVRPGGGGWIGE